MEIIEELSELVKIRNVLSIVHVRK
jgi:hypothetical protein